MSDVVEARIAISVCERDRVWRSHTGCLFKWGNAGNTWLIQRPDSDEWVDLCIRTAYADQRTPFVAVAPKESL